MFMKKFLRDRVRDFIWSILTVWIPLLAIVTFCIFASKMTPEYTWEATALFTIIVLIIDFIIIKKKW